jgi:hypothetical protein
LNKIYRLTAESAFIRAYQPVYCQHETEALLSRAIPRSALLRLRLSHQFAWLPDLP